jgi:two-component system response regulator ChvI
MSQRDAHLGRGYSSVWASDRLSATLSQDEPDSTAPAAIGHAKVRRVVLVESDQYYREVLTGELLRQGFVVHAFSDGASLLASLATVVDADLAVLDWDLPKMPGIKLLAELRQHGVNLPVVFLTGKVIAGVDHDQCLLASPEALNADECMAFDQGAIDFIAKSRDRQVLVRRLRRVVELARSKAGLPRQEGLAWDRLRLKPEISRAYWNQVDVGLTLGEYKIVNLLASNVGRYVTYRAVYDCLHYEGFIAGSGNDGFRANVRSAIKRIRNKFRACDPAFDEIENYNGFGYCWRKPSGEAAVIQPVEKNAV